MPRSDFTVSLLPRRLLARVTEEWRDLGLTALRADGYETTKAEYVEEWAARKWYTQLFDNGRRPEDDVVRRVEAIQTLLRPEAPDIERAAALVVATQPMPPDMFRDQVLTPMGLAVRRERFRG